MAKTISNIPPHLVHDACLEQGREVTPHQSEQLAVYLQLLMAWNARVNLVGPSNWRTVLATLAADSWHLSDCIRSMDLPHDVRSLDIGAGGGLPGIPLRLFWAEGEYVMVEVRQKRAAFLSYALSRLDLARTTVFHGRAEDLPADLREADLVLGRAFRPWLRFLALAATLLKSGGTTIIMANQPAPPEHDIPSGWRLTGEWPYTVAGTARYFWSLSWSS